MGSDAFPATFWRRLLRLIDAELDEDVSMVVIGGAAIALKYASSYLTRDLDTITTLAGTPAAAVRRAQHALQIQDGLADPPLVGSVGVYDAPEGFEERCIRLPIRGLRHSACTYPSAMTSPS